MSDQVYAVHATRADDVGAIEVLFRTADEAVGYAKDRSTDWRVLAVSVTRFTVGELGTRHPMAWFVDGEPQPPRAARPGGSYYPTDGGR